jgi:hypothetical protein
MFTITVKDKTYTVKKVTPRALYEMQPALDMFNKINLVTQASLKGEVIETPPEDIKQAMNTLLDWFVIFCGEQFSREDLLDGYGADSIIRDIGVAIRAVQMQVTEAITAFPTTAKPSVKTAETAKPPTATSRFAYIRTALKKALRRK